MKFMLGDKLLINGVETTIKFINNDLAWVSDDDAPHVAINIVDKRGYTRDGHKVKCINNNNCGAV